MCEEVCGMEAGGSRFVRYWWVVALAALAAGAITTAAAEGFPILELEFAWTAQGADDALAGADLDAVRATILWDFVFLALYASALYLGSLWASGVLTSERLRQAGPHVAVGAVAAGVLDVIENLAMLGHLNGWLGFSGWPTVAGLMAVPKFILVLVAVVYVVMGIATAVAHRVRRNRTS
jgi:hypothetical protein